MSSLKKFIRVNHWLTNKLWGPAESSQKVPQNDLHKMTFTNDLHKWPSQNDLHKMISIRLLSTIMSSQKWLHSGQMAWVVNGPIGTLRNHAIYILLTGTFKISPENKEFYRFIRLIETGCCWHSNARYDGIFSMIEFFGKLKQPKNKK